MDALDTSIAPDASIESDTSNASTASKQWPASLNLDFYRSAHRSHVHRSHRGPLRIQRPFYPEGDVCHVILLHPPGGLVSGDRLDMTVSVGANAHAVVTAPGAMKHYRTRIANANHARMPDHIGMVNQCIDINNGALEWMPNESIHYDGSVTRSLSQFNLFNHAKVLSLDVQVFGRQAGQHDFLSGKVDVGLQIYKHNRPVLLDNLRVYGQQSIESASALRGFSVMGHLWASPVHAHVLDLLRKKLDAAPIVGDVASESYIGVTLIEDILFIRFLGHDSEHALQVLRYARELLRPIVFGRASYTPRIWST